jgi:hypothetical protein
MKRKPGDRVTMEIIEVRGEAWICQLEEGDGPIVEVRPYKPQQSSGDFPTVSNPKLPPHRI